MCPLSPLFAFKLGAIPAFTGARQRAEDGAAPSEIRNALVDEKITYNDTQAYDSNAVRMKPWTSPAWERVGSDG